MPALSHNPFIIRDLHSKIFTLCQICVHPSDRFQLVYGPHFVVRHQVSVSHCRRNIAVTKELFHSHDVNSVHDQVACERVAERVDVRVLYSKLFGQLSNVFPERSIISIRAVFFKSISACGFPPQLNSSFFSNFLYYWGS